MNHKQKYERESHRVQLRRQLREAEAIHDAAPQPRVARLAPGAIAHVHETSRVAIGGQR